MSLLKLMFLAASLLCVAKTHAGAQTADTPAVKLTADDFSVGEIVEDQPIVEAYYDKGRFGDWTLKCVKTNEPIDPCQLFQLMRNADGSPVAEFNLNIIKSNGAVVAGANVITPLETLLTAQLTIRVGENKAKVYPFVFCLKIGCVARIGLTKQDIEIYRAGKQATITMVPAGAPNQNENLILSLVGFTAGHQALMGN